MNDEYAMQFVRDNIFNPEFSTIIYAHEESRLRYLINSNEQNIQKTFQELKETGQKTNIDIEILYEKSKNKEYQFGHISQLFGQYFENEEICLRRLKKGKSVFFEKGTNETEDELFQKKKDFIKLFEGINPVSDGFKTYSAILGENENELLKHFTLFERIYLGKLSRKEYARITHGEEPLLFFVDGLNVDNYYWATEFERENVIKPLFNELKISNEYRPQIYQIWLQKTRRLSLTEKLSRSKIKKKEIGIPIINLKRSLDTLLSEKRI